MALAEKKDLRPLDTKLAPSYSCPMRKEENILNRIDIHKEEIARCEATIAEIEDSGKRIDEIVIGCLNLQIAQNFESIKELARVIGRPEIAYGY